MRRRAFGSLAYYEFENLSCLGVKHGVFTRLGGYSCPPYASLNVSYAVGDDSKAVSANHRVLYQALRINEGQVVTAEQVHGNRVAQVYEADRGCVVRGADGLISNLPGVALMLRFADCVPILLYDPNRNAVGLAHAGWRGTMRDIAGQIVQAMAVAFGSDPAGLVVALGPAIGPCCYQVGIEVIAAATEIFPASLELVQRREDGSYYFDLLRANVWQLRQAGVENLETASICTSCHVDEFYSHRKEQGMTGRFGVLIGLDG